MSPATVSRGADQGPRRSGRAVWSLRLSAALLGLLLPLLAVELALRLIGPVLPGNYDTGVFLVRHPTLGHFHVPGFDGWRRAPEFTTHIKFNQLGLRDTRAHYLKPDGAFRVMVFGDSFVEALQVDSASALTSQLEGLLQTATPRTIEVINAGVGGFGTGQELLLLEQEGRHYRPDLVVVLFFVGNDLANNNFRLELWNGDLRSALKPYWELDDAGQIRMIPPPPPSGTSGPGQLVRSGSVLFNVIETGLVNKLALDAPGEPIEAIGGLRQPIRGQYDTRPEGEWRRAWRTSEVLLSTMRDRAQQIGASLVLVGVPEARALDTAIWRKDVASEREAAGRLQPSAPTDHLAVIASRLGVRYLDLLPPLQGSQRDGGRPVYYQYDRHWNAAGHRAAAEALAQFLTATRLIP